MYETPHRIHRQRWELRVPNAPLAFALRTELRNQLEQLQPILESAFDAACPANTSIHLPRLTLKLRLDASQGLSALPELLREQIAVELQTQLRDALAAATGRQRESNADPRLPKQGVYAAPQAEQRRASFEHYLRHGQLPWFDCGGTPAQLLEWLQPLAIEQVKHWMSHGSHLRAALPAGAPDALCFVLRLLQLLPEALLAELEPLLQIAEHAPQAPLQRALERHGKQVGGSADSALMVRALRLVVAQTLPSDAGAFVAELLAMPALAAVHRLLQAVSAELQQGVKSGLPVTDKAPRRVADALGPTKPQTARVKEQETPSALRPAPNAAPQAVPPAPDSIASRKEDAPTEPGIWLRGAGLVLIHPFLPSLFSACGLLEETQRALQPTELPRAAALLHWLAWGNEQAFEFELDLIKILLGLKQDSALPIVAGLLRESDRAECQALLEAVISHWSALRGTRAAGLQLAFLQRPGLLRATSEGSQLQLESAAFDVLLAQLPWGIQVVKLAWMLEPLFVEWPTA